MTAKHLSIHLLSLCIGVFAAGYMLDHQVADSLGNCYWCVFGGVFVWFKMRGNKNETK